MKYNVYAVYDASKYIGEIEAKTPEAAEEQAWDSVGGIMLCHQCNGEIEIGDAIRLIVEPVEPRKKPAEARA